MGGAGFKKSPAEEKPATAIPGFLSIVGQFLGQIRENRTPPILSDILRFFEPWEGVDS
jgi:hypothetical protein